MRVLRSVLIITFLIFGLKVQSQNLSVIELLQLSNKPNWESVNTYLTGKGWEYYDSKEGDDNNYNVVTWSLEKNYYDEKAQGWFKLYTFTGYPNKVSYQFRKKATYANLKSTLSTNGFKYIDTEIKDDHVISKYVNQYFIVELSYLQMKEEEDSYTDNTHTSYIITVIKKAGVYDADNGLKKTFHSNGNVENEYTLKDGELSGTANTYYENGNLKITSNFVKGKKNGNSKEYDENGLLTGEFSYLNGELNGPYKIFENSNLKLTGSFKNGIKDGLFKFYNDENKIEKEYFLTAEKLNGAYTEYYYKDNALLLKVTGQYINDEKTGFWQTVKYKENKSDVLEQVTYKNGNKEGDFKDVVKDSIIFGSYLNGKLNGKYKVYTTTLGYLFGEITGDTANSILMVDGNYYQGNKSGYWKKYSITKVLRSEGNYYDDEKTGEWKYYYDNISEKNNKNAPYSKELYLIENYENGKLNGKCTRYSYLERKPVLCDTAEYKNANPLDTCYTMDYQRVLEISYYKNDELFGPFERKDANGKIILKGNLISDKKEGEWFETINDDGDTYSVNINYKKGEPNGKIIYKDSLNNNFRIGFFEDGKRTGIWKDFFSDGSVSAEYSYVDGKLNGQYIDFLKNGKYREISNYEKGDFQSLIIYDSLGNEIIRKFEILSKENNSFYCRKTQFDQEGRVSQVYRLSKKYDEEVSGNLFELTFLLKMDSKFSGSEAGYADGEHKEYDSKNNILVEGKYYKKDKVGLWTYYYPEISVKIEQEFNNDIGGIEKFVDLKKNLPFSGKFVLKNGSGNKTCEFKVDEGIRDGKSKYFDVKGELTKTEKYEKGVLQIN